MCRRKRKRHKQWPVWDLFDGRDIPKPSEQAFSKALDQLKLTDAARRAKIMSELKDIAVSYWTLRRENEKKPPFKYYRGSIKPVRTATIKLLNLMQHVYWSRASSSLMAISDTDMQRPVFKGGMDKPESFEEILMKFIGVCDKIIALKQSSGRRHRIHVDWAAANLAVIWHKNKGESVGLSLEVNNDEHWKFGPSDKTFIYQGPLFVQTVLQGIDAELQVAQIRTALRNVLEKKRMKKLKAR